MVALSPLTAREYCQRCGPSVAPAKQNVINAIVRENAARMLIYGPSLAGGRHARPDTRMEVISARRADAVRVETFRQ